MINSIPSEIRRAQIILRVLTPDEYFMVDERAAIRSLEHSLEVIPAMKRAQYEQFALGDQNDFAIWVKQTIGDHDLSEALIMTREDREETIRRIEARIAYLDRLLDELAGQLSLEEQIYNVH